MAPPQSSTSKRPAAGQDASTNAHNWKKRKMDRTRDARVIQTQAHTAASSAASSVMSSPGPSTGRHAGGVLSSAQHLDQANLPTSIELESLVSSRAFQIQSFLKAIKSAKSATTTRAWQLLPRHARRRAASHNLLRLPSRLRGKARAELRSSTTQARTKSEIRKRLPDHGVLRATLRRQKLAQRASHPKRRWLETHMWHAKRFRMSTEKGKGKEKDQGTEYGRWGFVLPETTMMKSHKASWRSALEYVTVHDASYTSMFRLGVRASLIDGGDSHEEQDQQLQAQLRLVLQQANFRLDTDSSLPLVFDTVLLGQVENNVDQQREAGPSSQPAKPAAALAPVRILTLPRVHHFRRTTVTGEIDEYRCCEALLFVHPAGELYVRRALKQAGVSMLDERKSVLVDLMPVAPDSLQTYAFQLESAPDPWLAAGGKDSTMSKLEKRRRRKAFDAGTNRKAVVDTALVNGDSGESSDSKRRNDKTDNLDDTAALRRKQGYNVFELVGPRACALLRAVLKLDSATLDANRQAFQQITQPPSTDKEAMPSPRMVAVSVHDPRLSYPPKLKPDPVPTASSSNSSTTAGTRPSEMSAAAESRLLSLGAESPRFSKGEIDSRRARSTGASKPGARLESDPQRDDLVTVVLIRKDILTKPSILATYTLLVPRGWGSAFFMSLVATHQSGASQGARVLGQHQLRHQRLELMALCSSSKAENEAQSTATHLLSYPFNWIGTLAFTQTEKEAVRARQEEWSKRPRGKRTEFAFPTSKEWESFVEQKGDAAARSKVANDRVGALRPMPFGGADAWNWAIGNSERLYGGANGSGNGTGSHVNITKEKGRRASQSWLVAGSITSAIEMGLSQSSLASALVPVRLHAVRKGTVEARSSLMLATSFEEQLMWIHHLDSSIHPAMVANRNALSAKKLDKAHLKALIDRRLDLMQLGQGAPGTAPRGLDTQLATRRRYPGVIDVWSEYLGAAVDPVQLHDRSADWNNTIGLVLDGDYSLGNGSGFGIGAITLRAYHQLRDWQHRIDSLTDTAATAATGGRRRRNPVATRNLMLMREPGSDVVRAVTVDRINL
ncbi:POP1-domain-containing protein [Testicularia cyperi]|uniref:POP1-domain-containing protein n=1 Tax=Testicularia cyperi TaxID=1882483 RepID=A0A317XSJ2_9BASI|nr:POP1-domain-containing protein [Testicularia cyperi]